VTVKAPGFLVRLAAVAGLLLSAILCGILIAASLSPERNYIAPAGNVFHRLLQDYDLIAAGEPGREGLDSRGRLDTLNFMLDRMEKNVQGVESWLSLLKRRRVLARLSPRMIPPYRESSSRAAAAFPWSQPLAVLALDGALLGAPITEETAGILQSCGARIDDAAFSPLVLAASILCGDFADPARAAEKGGETLLSAALPLMGPRLPGGLGDRFIVNLALLKLINQDYRGAEAQIQGLSRIEAAEQGTFLGEYYYDFRPLRAAEIFSRVENSRGLLRSAEALWLGGESEGARHIWLALSKEDPAEPETRFRSLYNLGASDPEGGEPWFALLYQAGEENPPLREDPCYGYGLIAYTRNLPPYEALAVLEERKGGEPVDAAVLEELEILRRRGELWTPDRTAAETWTLLGRRPGDRRIFQWAAWYFDYQRRRDDSAVLLRTAGYRDIQGPWLDLSAALGDLESGRLGQAEERLRSITADPRNLPLWQAEANLGLILETRRAPAEALQHYETAAGQVKDSRAASRLQARIAGCLRTLGRKEESRRALLYSLDLNPGNIAARMELRRLEDR
jgi:tetratricopeptide (TPR) repeat protein